MREGDLLVRIWLTVRQASDADHYACAAGRILRIDRMAMLDDLRRSARLLPDVRGPSGR